MDYTDKVVCVYDYGLFVELAVRLSQDFGKVYYYNPTQKSAFPTSKNAWVGYGIDGVIQVDDFWDVVDEVDLFVFTDLYDADLQEHLVGMGKRVWGLRRIEDLETDRELLRNTQKDLGLSVPDTTIITGTDELKTYLQENENVYVKISYYRGDAETFHHINWAQTEPWFTDLESKLGLQKNDIEFFIEQPIEGVEAGWDSYTIDGEFPNKMLFGYEIKDVGYLGKFINYPQDAPSKLVKINEAFKPLYEMNKARGFFSTEVRVNETNEYLLDYCARCGSPPCEVFQEMYANLADIMWFGAEGDLIEPQLNAQYCGLVMIHSSWAQKGKWQPIFFPPEMRRWVKIKNLAVYKGNYYSVPAITDLAEIGAVIAIGNSYQDVIDKLNEYSSQISGYEIDIKTGSSEQAMEAINEGERYGIVY